MNKSILVITSSFPRGKRDLAGHFVEQWCRALVERGIEVDVLCWRGENAEDRRVCPGLSAKFVPYAWSGAEQLFFGAGAPENLARRPWRSLLAAPAMAAMAAAALRACGQKSYRAVVGHWMLPAGLIARSVGAMAGVRSLVVGHSGGVHLLGKLPEILGRQMARWLTSGPTTVPTDALRQQLVALGAADSVDVAPMGFSPGADGKLVANTGSVLKLGFLGRLVPIKGLKTVIEAVKAVRTEGAEVELTVVGDGPCRREWEATAGDGVEFVGARYGTEKWAYIKQWEGFVMPSQPLDDGRHEGLPVSLLEAASAGAVPLVSGVPGVEKWLVRPAEQVVKAGDVDAWSAKLRWLASLGKERHELRQLSRRAVAPLAWPRYGRWWQQWLWDDRHKLPRSADAHPENLKAPPFRRPKIDVGWD